MDEIPQLLTLREASETLKIHPNTLRLWDKQHILTAVRIGKKKVRRYKKKDILDLMDGKKISKKRNKEEKETLTQEKLLLLAAIIESSNDAFIGRDLHCVITSWNKAAEKIYHYTSAEAIGKNDDFLLPSDRKNETREVTEIIKKGKSVPPYRTKRVRKDGVVIDIEISVSSVKNAAGTIMGSSAIGRDITVEKMNQRRQEFLAKANAILSSSLEYKKTLNHIAKLAVPYLADWCAIDMFENGEVKLLSIAHVDPEKVKWAKELRKASPVDMESPTGIPNVLRTKTAELYADIPEEMLIATAKTDTELEIFKKIGIKSVMIVPLVARGSALGAISFISSRDSLHYSKHDLALAEELARRAAIAIDNATLYKNSQEEIQQRQKIEEELLQSRNQLTIILQNIADGVTVQDKKGKVIFANEAAAIAAGFVSSEHMMEAHEYEKTPEEYKRFTITDEKENPISFSDLPGRRALEGEEHPQAILRYADEKTGEVRWSLVKATPVRDKNGNVELAVNVVSDITNTKMLEKRKDEFISMASHELKTPVTSIKAFAQLVGHSLNKPEKKEDLIRYVKRMDEQIDRLTTLICDLLDVSRMQSGKMQFAMETFDFNELMASTIENIQPTTTTHSITLKGLASTQVLADRNRIGQVLINLLTNAIKYSPQGKKIIVSVSETETEVIVSVQDYGIGIPEKLHKKIFERFYRVDETREKMFPGLGIGLYISHQIVERHQGRMWVESAVEKGSRFYFSLPKNRQAYEKK